MANEATTKGPRVLTQEELRQVGGSGAIQVGNAAMEKRLERTYESTFDFFGSIDFRVRH